MVTEAVATQVSQVDPVVGIDTQPLEPWTYYPSEVLFASAFKLTQDLHPTAKEFARRGLSIAQDFIQEEEPIYSGTFTEAWANGMNYPISVNWQQCPSEVFYPSPLCSNPGASIAKAIVFLVSKGARKIELRRSHEAVRADYFMNYAIACLAANLVLPQGGYASFSDIVAVLNSDQTENKELEGVILQAKDLYERLF